MNQYTHDQARLYLSRLKRMKQETTEPEQERTRVERPRFVIVRILWSLLFHK